MSVEVLSFVAFSFVTAVVVRLLNLNRKKATTATILLQFYIAGLGSFAICIKCKNYADMPHGKIETICVFDISQNAITIMDVYLFVVSRVATHNLVACKQLFMVENRYFP